MLLPGSWNLYSKRIRKLIRRGDTQGAYKLARNYTSSNPADVRGWHSLAFQAARAGAMETEQAAYAEAARLAPDDPWYRYQMASTMLRRGKRRHARRAYEELIRDHLVPPVGEALGHVGLVGVCLHEHDPDAARAHSREAERLLPPDKGKLIQELAEEVVAISGELSWAERLYRKAVEAGADTIARVVLATIVEQSDPAEARRQIELARVAWHGTPAEFEHAIVETQSVIRDMNTGGA